MQFSDFNALLHALRTRELRQAPPGAKVFLSAGCAGRWYFDWISENYQGVKRHLGIEAYSPKPANLPAEAIWLADHIHDMKSVAANEADLVFAGQTVEHLWPDEFAGFLCEAHRTLKPEGWLILDSPNRLIAQALNWYQPQHTMEFSVDEIVELVTLTGFRNVRVKGLWLCYDRDRHTYLPLIPDVNHVDLEAGFRVVEATHRPEDSFIWWLEAQKNSSRLPNQQQLTLTAHSIYDRVFTQALQRTMTQSGVFQGYGSQRVIRTIDSRSGYLRFGPYVPLRPGNYMARFQVGLLRPPEKLNQYTHGRPALKLDVSAESGSRILVERQLYGQDLLWEQDTVLPPAKPNWAYNLARRLQLSKKLPQDVLGPHFMLQELAFSLKQVTFGVEFRALTLGVLPVVMRAEVELIDFDAQAQLLSGDWRSHL